MDIGPGDFVECVDATDFAELTVGTLYRVLAIEPSIHPEWTGVPVLIPSGFPEQGGGLSCGRYFCGCALRRFRKAYRPKASLIEGLLEPILEAA